MKAILLFLCLNIMTSLQAQTLVFGNEEIEYEEQQVFSVLVKTEPSPKAIRSNFEDWMDDKHDVDLDGRTLLFFNKDNLSGKGIVIPEISNKKIDLFALVDETKEGVTKLNVIASFGYDNWFDPYQNPVEFMALQDLVYDFVENYLPEYYATRISESQANIEELSENRSEFNEELKENMEEIEVLNQENAELRKKINDNQTKMSAAKQRLLKRKGEKSTIEDKIDGSMPNGQ